MSTISAALLGNTQVAFQQLLARDYIQRRARVPAQKFPRTCTSTPQQPRRLCHKTEITKRFPQACFTPFRQQQSNTTSYGARRSSTVPSSLDSRRYVQMYVPREILADTFFFRASKILAPTRNQKQANMGMKCCGCVAHRMVPTEAIVVWIDAGTVLPPLPHGLSIRRRRVETRIGPLSGFYSIFLSGATPYPPAFLFVCGVGLRFFLLLLLLLLLRRDRVAERTSCRGATRWN